MDSGNSRVVDRDSDSPPSSASLRVRNVGGIDESRVRLEPGVNLLVGENATNRTSHLQGLAAALGSDEASIRSDASEARAVLEMDGERYERELVRENGRVVSSGSPLLNDPELGDLFAFLLESNEARRAVVRDADLRELIMRPVDTEAIDREIEQTRSRRDEIDSELAELDDLERRLPSLQEEFEQYQREIETHQEARADLERQIEQADADLEESRRERDDLERKLADLQDCRSDLEDVRYRIETETDSIDSLEAERTELESELESLSITVQDINELGAEIDRLHRRKEQLDSTIDRLRNVVQFNQEMLDEGADLHDVVGRSTAADGDGGSPTDRLLGADQQDAVCWTCGSDVDREDISSMVTELQGVSEDIMEMRRSVKSGLEECRREKKEIEAAQNRRNQLENQITRIEQEIESRRETRADLEAEREELKAEIESLEAAVEDTQEAEPAYERVLDLHRRANEEAFEIERLRESRDEVAERIDEIESRLADYEDLEAERERLGETLTDLRTRIDRLERSAVESFNEQMDEVLSLLGYGNVERIWIERTETEASEGRQTVTRSTFDLHVARSSDSGTVYRDSVDHLSESEREVTGLVFALSGYLAHEVHETVPFLVLDSLEAIDADRIAALVEYLEGYAEYVVVALLEEDARALSDDYNHITDVN